MKKTTVKKTSVSARKTSAKTATAKSRRRKGTSSKKTVKKTSKASDDIIQINVWNIKLAKESKKRLNKVKDCMWGTVAHAIEWGNWYIPVENYRYTHIKKRLEDGMREFFEVKKDIPVEIEDFQTHILEYDNH